MYLEVHNIVSFDMQQICLTLNQEFTKFTIAQCEYKMLLFLD